MMKCSECNKEKDEVSIFKNVDTGESIPICKECLEKKLELGRKHRKSAEAGTKLNLGW